MKTLATKKIKTFILVLFLMLFCPMGLFAQQTINFKTTETGKITPLKDYSIYQKKANKYAGVTAAGGALLVAGAILTGVSVNMVKESEFGSSEDVTGVGLFLGSVVLVAGGTAMTIVGAVNLGKARHNMRQIKYEVSPNPAISGVTVRIRF